METYACSKLKVKRLFTSELVREWRAYGPPGDFELEPARQETAEELRERVRLSIQLLRAQPEANIGILSHGVFLAELARHIGRPLHAGMHNAQVIHLHNVPL
jgi:broad specificity phosphatase PhoE